MHLKLALKKIDGLSVEFLVHLDERNIRRNRTPSPGNYSPGELRMILAAARTDVRRAARRIRGNRALLEQWRLGQVNPGGDRQSVRRGELLDFLDRHDDVPRYTRGARQPQGWVERLGQVSELLCALHLTMKEAAAFTVLLASLTGQNLSTIVSAPAAHHRADGYAGGPATAIVELDKHRRGSRRHMDTPFTDLPPWVPVPAEVPAEVTDSGGIALNTPFGFYMLLVELAAVSRERLGSKRLLVWRTAVGAQGAGLREDIDHNHVRTWAAAHDLPASAEGAGQIGESGPRPQLNITITRLRLSFAELSQKPVAHTEATLANAYLLRNRGNLAEYQQVVAKVLDREVAKARSRGAIGSLDERDLAAARNNPAAIAAKHSMDPRALRQLLAGELDTVMAGCVNNTASPHSAAGQPCRASFMLCLGCPCARATPRHLPTQVLVRDALEQRRLAMTPLRWAERFALTHAQLSDLLDQAGPAAVDDARRGATATEHALVQRFLDQELDLR
jgi:hypothetical protein